MFWAMFPINATNYNFHFFDISLRCKFESSRYGVSSTIQKSSKFEFNSNPYLQPRQACDDTLYITDVCHDVGGDRACRCSALASQCEEDAVTVDNVAGRSRTFSPATVCERTCGRCGTAAPTALPTALP